MRPPIDVTAIKWPARRRRMYGSAACRVAATPNTLVANCARNSDNGVSSKVPSTP